MITRKLLEQGQDVRILVRPNSNYQPLVEAGAQPVLGDLKDRASLDPAVKGVDVVITTANSAMRGGDDNPQTVDLEGNRNLIDAAKEAGVKQFIFTSVLTADPNSPVPFMAAKGKTNDYLRESGIPHTILAPNAFMEIWAGMVVGMPVQMGQPVTVVGEGKRRHSLVSMGDVAEFAVRSVNNPAATNQRIAIGGPEPVSWHDVAATYSRVLGREVPVRSIPIGEHVPGVPEPVMGLLIGFEMSDSDVDMEETCRTYGVTLTPLEEVVRRQVGGA
jgi:NADH dehydrogenase